MSKLVKSSKIIIDKKKYILSNEYFIPQNISEDDEDVNLDDRKTKLEDELRVMKEVMLEEIKIESDNIKSTAQEEFNSIVEEAYNRSDQINEQAKKEGYEAGYNEGYEKGYSELNDVLSESLLQKEKYYLKYENIKNEAESDLTQIIISIVEKILNKHVKEDHEVIKGIVEKALVKCAFTHDLAMRVAPEDFEVALLYKNYILSLTENVENIDIKQDSSLIQGSCIIDTDAGSIDSSVSTQFQIIKGKFMELLKSE